MNEAQHILRRLKRLVGLEEACSTLEKDSLYHASLSVEIDSIRTQLPTAILRHHDSRILRGKKSLAPVTGGVCGACHLTIPRGHLGALRKSQEDLDVCDHCGVFIYLAEESEGVSLGMPKHPAKETKAPRILHKPKPRKITPAR